LETYLEAVLDDLGAHGHPLAFLSQVDAPVDRPPLAGLPTADFCLSRDGHEKALAWLAAWKPEVIYVNGLIGAELEEMLLQIAPTVLSIHSYHGTCISGSKTVHEPTARPCHRRFGPPCLIHYFPLRCGGRNPFSMWNWYRAQRERLERLPLHKRVVTHSLHMHREYLKHGIANECLPISHFLGGRLAVSDSSRAKPTQPPHRLLFLGRLEALKGGQLLLEALPRAAAALERPLELTFAGDGSQKERWQAEARALVAKHPNLKITFIGWVDSDRRARCLDETDVLVVPSVWPEPFGMVGLEAFARGVPVVAFAVGAIPEWLESGKSGALAEEAASAGGLADALASCMKDSETYLSLARGAHEAARAIANREGFARLRKILDGARRSGVHGEESLHPHHRPA
jgi:glycosyltransferase involved in cell wall biosynthesis